MHIARSIQTAYAVKLLAKCKRQLQSIFFYISEWDFSCWILRNPYGTEFPSNV